MKAIRYWFEGRFAELLFAVMMRLPLPLASGIGSFIARLISPYARVHSVAKTNLARVMPHLSEAEQQAALRRMWDNLGRVLCEYPKLNHPEMVQAVQSVSGANYLHEALQTGRPVVLISGHLGNWELPAVYAASIGIKLHLLYRAANNKAVDRLITRIRTPFALGLHDKGLSAARRVVKAMQQREPIALLLDQKSNDGICVPFMGIDAMSSDLIAHLVLKYNPLVLPARCIRKGACRFAIEVEPPLQFALTGQKEVDALIILRQVHSVLERWIAEDPSQWFWVHKRWPFSTKVGT